MCHSVVSFGMIELGRGKGSHILPAPPCEKPPQFAGGGAMSGFGFHCGMVPYTPPPPVCRENVVFITKAWSSGIRTSAERSGYTKLSGRFRRRPSSLRGQGKSSQVILTPFFSSPFSCLTRPILSRLPLRRKSGAHGLSKSRPLLVFSSPRTLYPEAVRRDRARTLLSAHMTCCLIIDPPLPSPLPSPSTLPNKLASTGQHIQ